MYYRLYRRRYYFYGAAILIALIILITNKRDQSEYHLNKRQVESKQASGEINIFNYVAPAPCSGCPGENGAAVYLSVNNKNV